MSDKKAPPMMGRKLSGGIPADLMRGGAPSAAEVLERSLLSIRLGKVARGQEVDLPGGLGRAYIKILSHLENSEVEEATVEEASRRGIVLTESLSRIREVRTIAYAIRVPGDIEKRFAPLEEWQEVDEDLTMACYLRYTDVRQCLDPVSIDDVTVEQASQLLDAFKKKDRTGLVAHGLARLSAWLLTGELQQWSSPIAASLNIAPTLQNPMTTEQLSEMASSIENLSR